MSRRDSMTRSRSQSPSSANPQESSAADNRTTRSTSQAVPSLLLPSLHDSIDQSVSASGPHASQFSIASYYFDPAQWGTDSQDSLARNKGRYPPSLSVRESPPRVRTAPTNVTNSSNYPSQHDGDDDDDAERPFSNWAAGLDYDHSFGLEDEGKSALEESMLSTTTQQKLTTRSSPLRYGLEDDQELSPGPSRHFIGGRHGRDFSSATEGDVGVHPYIRVDNEDDERNFTDLPLDHLHLGPKPEDSVSYLGAMSSRNSSFIQMATEVPHQSASEVAALTAFTAPSGKVRQSEGYSDMRSGDRLDMEPRRLDRFFSDEEEGIPRRVESPSSLEEAGDAEMNMTRDTHRSSADMYAQMGISSRNGEGSGVERAKQGLTRVGKSIRRISRRVINLDGEERPNTEGVIRLPDHQEIDESSSDDDVEGIYAVEKVQIVPSKATSELRGKSLGIFGPENPFRRSVATLMSQWWIEPIILMLIIFNMILLVLQSSRDVFKHPRLPGYFDYWTDYGLLAVFVCYTIELVARIVVSGLIINPPAAYEAPQEQKKADDIVSSSPIETPFSQHLRAKAMRSNTLDTFAAMADTIKVRATEAVRPHNHLGQLNQHGKAPLSPNRAHAPRTVTSDILDGEPILPPHDRSQNSSSAKSQFDRRQPSTATSSSGQWREKTSTFLQKSKLAPFAEAISKQRAQAADYAFLRHSWNRIDLIAVASFWVMFILALSNEEINEKHHIFIFRALSVLRCARLLTVTRGTSVILRSLKTAGPLLVNVSFFTLFSMLLFSIIGVQSFEGNYRRSCLWVGDLQSDPNAPRGQNYSTQQMCGGHRDAVTGEKTRAIGANGLPLPISIKGFICPAGQLCVENDQNPENNTESFDNIFFALLQVIIVISSNGWSTIMYNMMDADYYASCLYFIIGLIVMNFWMANLFVAVITNTFATISAETKQSAFAAERIEPAKPAAVIEETAAAQRRKRVANVFKRFWGYTKWFWLALIVADLGVQASQASYHQTASNHRLDLAELYLTIAFDFEILVRFLSYLLDNDWRSFFVIKRNRFDLFLAVITTIIQIPAIKNSDVFPWLTVFQLARFYRVIIAVPRMEALLFRVFGSLSGLFNMIVFLLLMVGLASLLAVQLFRGDIPAESDGQTNEINFKQMWNSFLGMYQIFSSENWTTPLYSALTSEGDYKQAVIAGIFMCGWFLFANFIVLQMFIGVIAENFGIAESQKRAQQLELYLRNLEKPKTALIVRILQRLSPYRWLREHNAAKMGEKLPDDHPETRLQAERALDNIDEKIFNRRSIRNIVSPSKAQGVLKVVRKIARLDRPEEQMPLDTIRARQIRQSFSGASMLNDRRRQMSMYDNAAAAGVAATHAAVAASNEPSHFFSPSENMQPDSQDTARLFARDRQLQRMRSDLGLLSEEPLKQAEVNALHENRWKNDPRIAQARMINTHPSYEKSLWLFSNLNRFRRICQSIVPCSHGERLFGRQTSAFRLRIYQFAIFATIAASVIIAGVATPAYRRQWYQDHGIRRDSWFSLTEVTLSLIFIAEFFIKVIADGFAFTPNAYLLSPWNALDLFVLLTLLINVTTELAVIGGVSRFTRALKAFRALRLINLSDLMRRTFSALVAVGGRFIDASVLAILYIVPFAIWGQNLFSGLLYSCTDGSAGIINKASCIGEYGSSPSEWTFLAPRSWQNPTEGSVYSFDDFRSSLLILFEIVSLEGWTNVMATAMSVAGFNQQLQTDQRQINALFFVIYNLIGAVFVLTLFVAVIIESFQTFSGAAYLTTAQRQWIDLKRLIARQRPSKRPKIRPTDKIRSWCYDRAVHKHGWWSRSMTVLYLVGLITLATEMYNDSKTSEHARDIIYISLASVFAIDIGVRLSGLGWRSYRQDMWNLFDLIVVLGLFTTSIPLLSPNPNNSANVQLQKFFLVAVAFKLVQKNNALNQLFKTAISSLPSIVSLFLLWITFFLVWGIMFVEVFGLTKWNINETYNKNFSTLLKSLVFLAMMSTGEGWNSYMHDFTITEPYCTSSENYLNTDCGSEGWAYFLFIGWNVISMYIFLNMFTATVVENFSYVFQLGGKPTLSREQVRNFKKAWAEFDTGRSGVLRKDQFVPFFNRLDGSLEVRVYPAKATIKALKEKALTSKEGRPKSFDASSRGSRSPTRYNAAAKLLSPLVNSSHKANKEEHKEDFLWPPNPNELIVDGVNITALNRQLGKFDHADIKRRKMRFERLYHEACLLQDHKDNRNKGGLSFTDMLLLLAHYKLIDDEQALSLDELVDRRELMQLVEDKIETERIRGILRQIWLRRRFLAIREAKQRLSTDRSYASLQNIPGSPNTQDIPSINIQDDQVDNGKQKARQKPALRLDLGNLNDPISSDRQFVSRFDDDSPSPNKTKTLRQAGLAGEHPSILLTTSGDDEGMYEDDSIKQMSLDGLSPKSATPKSYMNELSPSPSLQELERQASPIIQEIDTSAWGSVARRLSADHSSLEKAREGANSYAGAAAASSSSSHRQSAFSRMNPFKSRKRSDADQQQIPQSREGNESAIRKVQSNTSFGSRDTNEMRESDHSSAASISIRSAQGSNQSRKPTGREGDWI